MKDYPRFGFQILDSKPIKVKGQLAYMLDLINKRQQKTNTSGCIFKRPKCGYSYVPGSPASFQKLLSPAIKSYETFHGSTSKTNLKAFTFRLSKYLLTNHPGKVRILQYEHFD